MSGEPLPAVEQWDSWRPEELAARLIAVDVKWAVAAGWAIELFVGGDERNHADLEIAVPRASFPVVRDALPGLDWYGAGDGVIFPLEDAPPEFHQTWGWDRRCDCWRVDVFREPWQGDTWIYRREPSIHRSWASIIRRTLDGIPYLAPEVALLFKSKHSSLEKNSIDFARTLPLLDKQQCRWLEEALCVVHPEHEWIARLG